jgi:hypothetical protein
MVSVVYRYMTSRRSARRSSQRPDAQNDEADCDHETKHHWPNPITPHNAPESKQNECPADADIPPGKHSRPSVSLL